MLESELHSLSLATERGKQDMLGERERERALQDMALISSEPRRKSC